MSWTRSEFLAAAAALGATAGPGAASQAPAGAQQARGPDLGSLHDDAARLAASHGFEESYADGRITGFDEFQRRARARVLSLLHHAPPEVDPRPELIERVDRGDYVREKVVFSTTPEFRVPAYVLVPKRGRRPLPAVVDLHSHGGMFLFGKEKVMDLAPNHPAMTVYHRGNYDGRPTATELVRRGYVVITIDAFGFGERRLLMEEDARYGRERSKFSVEDVEYLNRKCRAKESTLMKELAFAGTTWPGLVFLDDMRTVSYLASREEVDPKRIGCTGISMGGYRSLFLAALDRRIRADVVVGFMSTVRPMMRQHVDTHSMVHFLPGLHRYLDWPDVASLTAPRALLVQQCSRDGLFPIEGMRESVAKIAKAYGKAGVGERFSGRFYDAPHMFTRAMQDEAFEWLGRELGA